MPSSGLDGLLPAAQPSQPGKLTMACDSQVHCAPGQQVGSLVPLLVLLGSEEKPPRPSGFRLTARVPVDRVAGGSRWLWGTESGVRGAHCSSGFSLWLEAPGPSPLRLPRGNCIAGQFGQLQSLCLQSRQSHHESPVSLDTLRSRLRTPSFGLGCQCKQSGGTLVHPQTAPSQRPRPSAAPPGRAGGGVKPWGPVLKCLGLLPLH